MKRRKPWLAALLSLVCPGLGQLYNGDLRWPLAGLLAGTVITVVSTLYLFDTFQKLVVAVLLGLAFDIVFAVHAFRQARRLQSVQLKPYQRWWIYVGFAVVLYGSPGGYGLFIPERFLSFQIPSESMVPTLLVGDRLVADGWAYWGKDPQRGDVVVFDYPREPSIKYVKRLIGLPGDTVEVRGGELFLNGQLVPQRRGGEASLGSPGWQQVEFIESLGAVEHPIYRSQPPMNLEFGPVKVPEGQFFMMGDNRDRSSDSRVWGFVKRDAILGRMAYVYFSWDGDNGSVRGDRLGRTIK